MTKLYYVGIALALLGCGLDSGSADLNPTCCSELTFSQREMAVTPPTKQRGKMRVLAVRPPISELLQSFCLQADRIAIGRVEAVVRRGFTPIGGAGPKQHTVFRFVVERDLRGGPGVLSIRQNHGDLQFQGPDGTYSGTRLDDEPLLDVGSRYLMFLTYAVKQRAGINKHAVTGTAAGARGVVGLSDELLVLGAVSGVYPLQEGRLVDFPKGPEFEFAAQDFRDIGRPLTGLSEEGAVDVIKNALKKASDARKINREIIERRGAARER